VCSGCEFRVQTADGMGNSGPGMFSEAIAEKAGVKNPSAQRPAMRWRYELAAGGWLGVLAFVYTAGAARPASLG
jgi:hypothetical protein